MNRHIDEDVLDDFVCGACIGSCETIEMLAYGYFLDNSFFADWQITQGDVDELLRSEDFLAIFDSLAFICADCGWIYEIGEESSDYLGESLCEDCNESRHLNDDSWTLCPQCDSLFVTVDGMYAEGLNELICADCYAVYEEDMDEEDSEFVCSECGRTFAIEAAFPGDDYGVCGLICDDCVAEIEAENDNDE